MSTGCRARLGIVAALVAVMLAPGPLLAEPEGNAAATSVNMGTTEAKPTSAGEAQTRSEGPVEDATKPAATETVASSTPPGAAAIEPAQASSVPSPAAVAATPAAAAAVAPAAVAPTPAAAPAVPVDYTLDIKAALERVDSRANRSDKRDREGLLAAYGERNQHPIWVSPKGALPAAEKLAAEIRNSADWGLRPSDFDLPKVPASTPDEPAMNPEALADLEVRLSLAVLKYARHARGGRLEPTAITPFLDRKAQVYDPKSVLGQIATAADPGEYLRNLHPNHQQFDRLRRFLLALRDGGKGGSADANRVLANMEQWRWMPPSLGDFHVWVNVPEYLIRVVRDGKVVHTERVIVGKVDTQTPIFSHSMEQVIFHPFWGVPDSIKQNEILPGLQRGSIASLTKHNLRIQSGGRDIDPRDVDWTKTDIRRFHVYQPPGSSNVLGVVKFRFPNKHDVYMHDTPSKGLFKSSVRTFSHGCMRVQNPLKLAELVLAEDRNMAPERVRSLAGSQGSENNAVNLTRKVPVHVTYFTLTVDEAGKPSVFKDVYGHEERIRLALDGKMNVIKPVPQPKYPERAEPVGQLVEIKASPRNWKDSAFSGN